MRNNPGESSASRLLDVVHRDGPLSRAEATRRAGLARSAAGAAVESLTAAGLIRAGERAPLGSAGGRPSVVLEIADGGPFTVAVKVEPDGLRIAAYALGGRALRAEHHAADLVGLPPERLLALLAERTAHTAGPAAGNCVGVAVAYPGMLDETTGTVLTSLVLDRPGPAPLAEPLRELLARTAPDLGRRAGGPFACLTRDATATALGEYRAKGSGPGTLLVVSGERHGLGAALVGSPDRAQALEIGHLSVDPVGLPCPCGFRGCLERYVGGPALLAALGFDPSAPLTPEALRAAPPERVDESADRLGTALTGVVNTLGPDEVVLTGMLATLAAARPERMTAALDASVVARARGVRWSAGTTPDACLLGAADLAFRPFLSNPSPWTRGD
ncbi:ROK family transcriptional regulator (plasmid) [Streptomyces sp. BI20]|uniref:ROK family transcriptional regulator n=1 Tax=Streptomyces sp. BI20 TaxID=3403460 RepID=UPI003C731061